MAKFNAADAKQKLNEKLGEYGDEINNEDVFNYIYFLVYQRKKTKEDLLNDLNIFFEDKTQDFVYWTSTSRFHQEKPVRCRFFPNCTNSNCLFFHPTQKCTFYPNCKYGKNCSYIHEDETGNTDFNQENFQSYPKRKFMQK